MLLYELCKTSSGKPYKVFELRTGLGNGNGTGEKQANLHAITLRTLQAGNMYRKSTWGGNGINATKH